MILEICIRVLSRKGNTVFEAITRKLYIVVVDNLWIMILDDQVIMSFVRKVKLCEGICVTENI